MSKSILLYSDKVIFPWILVIVLTEVDLFNKVRLKQQQSMTKFTPILIINFVTPQAAVKLEFL
jgi:hypothetical protein